MPPTPNNPQPGPQNSLPAPPTAPQPVYLTPPPANLPPLPVTIAGSQLPIPPAPPAGFLGNLGTPATGAGGPSQPGQLLPPPTIPNLVLPSVPVGQALQTAGQGVGGGVGQALGAASTFATGAEAAPLVAAAKTIYDQVSGALKAAVDSLGESLQKVAAIDPHLFLDGINAITNRVPLIGQALTAINNQVVAFVEGLDRTAQRLAAFSPQLAVAQAQADVAQTLGDVRRAQTLGSGLARFTEAQSNLSQAAQDALVELLRPLLPIVTNILESLTVVVREIPNIPANIYNFFVDAINRIIDAINIVADKISFGTAATVPHLSRIARNTVPKDDPPSTALILNDLLGLSLPDSPAPPRGAGFTGFNE